MQSVAYFSVLLALASLALASSQPEQVQPGNSASPVVQVEPVQPQPQQPVVSSAPVAVHQEQGAQVVPIEHQVHHHHHEQHYPGASYYAPAGLIQVVGGEQQGVAPVQAGNKPGQHQPVRSVEQYGQPESAALPPNYKPFGSWGLYIGGNPADGYYTNYYKQLGSSVEKQQQGGEQSVKPTSALSPMLKQASGMSPFAGGDYYPFAYSVNELSSPTAAAVSRNYGGVPSVVESGVQHSPVVGVSPVQAGAQVYGSPASFESGHYGVSPYYSGVEHYAATKRLGSGYQVQQKEASKAAEMPVQQPAKGYQQSRVYVYPPQQVGPMSAPVAFSQAQPVAVSAPATVQHQQQHQHQQVVAYPVPVGSQIVGSQAGVDGAFAPYGVHAFTRYAVKPAVVSSAEQASYHYGVSSQVPAYKQMHQQQQHQQVHHSYAPHTHYYPSVGYYGYPLNQLHYSQGSIVPAVHGGEQGIYHSPSSQVVGSGSQVEASEKSETSDEKSQVNKQQQQKRA